MTMGKKENLFARDRTHQGLPTYPKGNQVKRSSELQWKKNEWNEEGFGHKVLE